MSHHHTRESESPRSIKIIEGRCAGSNHSPIFAQPGTGARHLHLTCRVADIAPRAKINLEKNDLRKYVNCLLELKKKNRYIFPNKTGMREKQEVFRTLSAV